MVACGEPEDEELTRVEAPPAPEQTATGDERSLPERGEEPSGPTGEPQRIFARRFVVKVRERPDGDSLRIGYMRAGAVTMSTHSEPMEGPGCRRGWFELSTGGWVCNGRDVVAFQGDRLPELRAAQADRTSRLPYQYAYARRDGVPVYRRLPSMEEAAEFEGLELPGAAVDESASVPAGIGGAAEPEEEGSPRSEPQAAGSGGQGPSEETARLSADGRNAQEGGESTEASRDAGPRDAGRPTLAALRNEDRESVLLRRLMRGFYVSLDREFDVDGRAYWRTQQNEYIPAQGLGMAEGSEFVGLALGAERSLPVAFIVSTRTRVYQRREDGRPRRGSRGERHDRFVVVLDEEMEDGNRYVGDVDGRLFRRDQVVVVESVERPPSVPPAVRWFDIDLTRQTLTAYDEEDRPAYVTLVSSGIILRRGVPELDHATPTGTFRIRARHLTATMDGDNTYVGPYSIQDVPFVMFYEQGYAIHGAFWHNRFGRPKSHGCINLAPQDAQWAFSWARPELPSAWHGIYPGDEGATWVHIHGETPSRR